MPQRRARPLFIIQIAKVLLQWEYSAVPQLTITLKYYRVLLLTNAEGYARIFLLVTRSNLDKGMSVHVRDGCTHHSKCVNLFPMHAKTWKMLVLKCECSQKFSLDFLCTGMPGSGSQRWAVSSGVHAMGHGLSIEGME